MNVLILGSGGREHALAVRVAQDETVRKVLVMPGNAGMNDGKVEVIPQSLSDFQNILSVCGDYSPTVVIVGPEEPLAKGVADYLEKNGISVFGPSQQAAQLESSKIFSKKLMQKYGVPTAAFKTYDSYEAAMKGLDEWNFKKGVVLKSDSLAAGKGVVVTHDRREAEETLFNFMKNPDCTVKTSEILIEEKLEGREISMFALCDGNDYFYLGSACDHKRVGDGDTGPNTGGMGCFTPRNWPSAVVHKKVHEQVFRPVIEGMKKEGMPYKGTLFAGLMINGDDVSVIEFNVRFGDPETQTLLPLVEGNFTQLLIDCAEGKLNTERTDVSVSEKAAIHVVMASGGYPSIDQTPLDTGHVINTPSVLTADTRIYYAGVKRDKAELVNSGGRVLGVTAVAKDSEKARKKAYQVINEIHFDGAHFRSDIGKRH